MSRKKYLRGGPFQSNDEIVNSVKTTDNIETIPDSNKNTIFLNNYNNLVSYSKEQYKYELTELKNTIISRFNKLNDINDGIYSITQKYAIHGIEQGFKPITTTDLNTISDSIKFLDETRKDVSSSIQSDNRLEVLNSIEKENIKQLLKLYDDRYIKEMEILNNYIKLQQYNIRIHDLQSQSLDSSKTNELNQEIDKSKNLQLENDVKLENIKLIQTTINDLFSTFGVEYIEYKESNIEKEQQIINLRNEKLNLENKLIEVQNRQALSYQDREKQIFDINKITNDIYELENKLNIESKKLYKIVNDEVEKNIIPKYIENAIDKLASNNLSNKGLLELENDLYEKKKESDNIISKINLNRKQINDKENEIISLKKSLLKQELFKQNEITYLATIINEKINKYKDALNDVNNQIIYIVQEKNKIGSAANKRSPNEEQKLVQMNNDLNQSYSTINENLNVLSSTLTLIDINYKEIYSLLNFIMEYDKNKYEDHKNNFITSQKKINLNSNSLHSEIVQLFSTYKKTLNDTLSALKDNYILKTKSLYNIYDKLQENIFSFTSYENSIIQLKKKANKYNEYPIYINYTTNKYKKYIHEKLYSFTKIITEENDFKYSFPISLETLKLTNDINIKDYQGRICEISSIVLKILKSKFITMYDDFLWKKYDFINIHYYKIKDIISLLYSLFESYNSLQKYYSTKAEKNEYAIQTDVLAAYLQQKNNEYDSIINSIANFNRENKESDKSILLTKQLTEVDNLSLVLKEKLFNFNQQLNIVKNIKNDIQQNTEIASTYDIIKRLYIKTPILIADYFLSIFDFDFYNSLTDLQQFLLKLNIDCKLNIVNGKYELIIENEYKNKYRDIIKEKKNELLKELKETNLFSTYLEFQLYYMIDLLLNTNEKLLFSNKYVYYYNYVILKKSKYTIQKINIIFPTYETNLDNFIFYHNPSFDFSNEMPIIDKTLNEESFFIFFLLNIYRQLSALSLMLYHVGVSLLQTSNIKANFENEDFTGKNKYSVFKAFSYNMLSYFIYNKKDLTSVLIPNKSFKITKITNTFNTSFSTLLQIKEDKYSKLKEEKYFLNENQTRSFINTITEEEFIHQNYLTKKKFTSAFSEINLSSAKVTNISNNIYTSFINMSDIFKDQFITYNLSEKIINDDITNSYLGYYLPLDSTYTNIYKEAIIVLLSQGVEMLKNNQVDLYNVEYTSEILLKVVSNL